jgi:hypothetical protein
MSGSIYSNGRSPFRGPVAFRTLFVKRMEFDALSKTAELGRD